MACDGDSAIEPVDSGSQVRSGCPTAKSGIGNAGALEVLTYPCGGDGVGDRLRACVRGAEELFHAIIEELCGHGVRRRERSYIGCRGICGIEVSDDVQSRSAGINRLQRWVLWGKMSPTLWKRADE